MGFFSNLVSGVVKVALTPVAVVADAVTVATGGDPDSTKDLRSFTKNYCNEYIYFWAQGPRSGNMCKNMGD